MRCVDDSTKPASTCTIDLADEVRYSPYSTLNGYVCQDRVQSGLQMGSYEQDT
jgi:hypothetical protein